MSADSWDICPKCLKKTELDLDRLEAKYHNSYGKVDVETYNKIKEEFSELNKKYDEMEDQSEDYYTLREDYEIGIYNFKFDVRYKGACTECDFVFEYNRTIPIDPAVE